MRIESDRLNFEQAAKIRDQMAAIRSTLTPQAITGHKGADTDVFAFFLRKGTLQAAVVRIAQGSVSDSFHYAFRDASEDDLIASCIMQFYLRHQDIPPLIYTDTLPESKGVLEDVLTAMRGSNVRIGRPSRGLPLKWIAMAQENAISHSSPEGSSALEEIARAFHLGAIPYRMECYDISTLQGESSAASRVVFIDGEPDKQLYRHYRIRTIQGQDDFAMLKEVFERRLTRDDSRPDLIVIDGGKGHLGVFLKVLEELGVPGVPVVSIAKARGEKVDRFFLPGRKDAVRLPERSAGLRTLQRIRDEAHRFALQYHRKLRSGRSASAFRLIPGIGPKKAKALLVHTSHLADPSQVTRAELEGIEGLSAKDIENVLAYLRPGT
jgi:excinuclease ABC subunit C